MPDMPDAVASLAEGGLTDTDTGNNKTHRAQRGLWQPAQGWGKRGARGPECALIAPHTTELIYG